MRVGTRAALDTFLEVLKVASLIDLEKCEVERALVRARRNMPVDFELTDIFRCWISSLERNLQFVYLISVPLKKLGR